MKDAVIQLYLQGRSRNDIAKTYGIGDGTVSNIIDEWKHRLGIHDAEAIRILVVNLKRLGIDEAQCAEGYRILMSMKKLGVNENEFKSFILEIYEYCKRYDLTPEHIASNLKELVKLSKDVPFAKIPEYIKEKKNTITKLEEDCKISKEKKESMEIETSLAEELRDAALENEKTTVAELREFTKFKTELGKYGLSVVDDTRKIVQVIYGIKQRGYDVDKVLSEYRDLQIKQMKHDTLSNQNRELEDRKMNLQSDCSFFESQVNLHSQRLYVYDELNSMGFGLTKLKIIRNTIKEIAAENNIIDYRMAVDRFFESLEQQYDIKLRQKTQKKEEYTKPNNLNPTFPSYSDIKPSTTLPDQSSLVEKQQRPQLPSRSISYTYGKITNSSRKTEEQNDQLNNDHDDEWYMDQMMIIHYKSPNYKIGSGSKHK
jgi:uncharacterized protein (DUF433 family)